MQGKWEGRPAEFAPESLQDGRVPRGATGGRGGRLQEVGGGSVAQRAERFLLLGIEGRSLDGVGDEGAQPESAVLELRGQVHRFGRREFLRQGHDGAGRGPSIEEDALHRLAEGPHRPSAEDPLALEGSLEHAEGVTGGRQIHDDVVPGPSPFLRLEQSGDGVEDAHLGEGRRRPEEFGDGRLLEDEFDHARQADALGEIGSDPLFRRQHRMGYPLGDSARLVARFPGAEERGDLGGAPDLADHGAPAPSGRDDRERGG